MQQKKIVFLASDCESSRWVYHALAGEFRFSAVLLEQPVSRKALFKRRMQRIGFFNVAGQALFSLLVVPVLRRQAQARKEALLREYKLSGNDFPSDSIRFSSVNDKQCIDALQQIDPDIVVVNGTRIISREVLGCCKAKFINMHVGITPAYRGSHGGYWAVRNNDLGNFGTTIHLVDTGVDTGAVLKQVFTKPAKEDNFTTYPVLQTAIGIPALKEVLHSGINGVFSTIPVVGKGKMYYQPSVWAYFFGKPRQPETRV